VKCVICSKFYDKAMEEEHLEEHVKIKCEFCSVEFQKEILD